MTIESNQAVCSGVSINNPPDRTVSWEEIVTLLAEPQQCDKEQARWIIPSAYPSRSFAEQRQHGRFWMLIADIDHGSPSLDQVCAAVGPHVGEFAVYATASATEAEPRWRVLVPLAEALDASTWGAHQSAFFDLLEAAGVYPPDGTAKRPGQLNYLPNRGAYYDWRHVERPRRLSDELTARAAKAQEPIQAAARERNPNSIPKHVAAFNRKHSVEEMLVKWGYARGRDDGIISHWRSPNQTTKSFATRTDGDHWISLSGSDADKGLGRASAAGSRHGDAYDLAAHYHDAEAIKQYAVGLLKEEQKAMAAHGEQLVAGLTHVNSKPIERDWEDEVEVPAIGFTEDEDAWAAIQDPLTAPGLIGLATRDYHENRADRDTPLPGYAGHIIALSAMMGFGFRSTFAKPDWANLQMAALMPQGYGKQSIFDEARDVFKICGFSKISPGSYTGVVALHTALTHFPYQCFLQDESGRKGHASSMNGGNALQSELATSAMEKFNSYSYDSRAYAKASDERPRVPYVYFTMLLATQPSTARYIIEQADLDNGKLDRLYFIYVSEKEPLPPLIRRTQNRPISAQVAAAYQTIAAWSRPYLNEAIDAAEIEVQIKRTESELSGQRFALREAQAEVSDADLKTELITSINETITMLTKRLGYLNASQRHSLSEPIKMVPDEGAKAVYDWFLDLCEKQQNLGTGYWNRAAQNAKRLAMVLALGEAAIRHGGERPARITISRNTMIWACRETAGRLRGLGLYVEQDVHATRRQEAAAYMLEYLRSKKVTKIKASDLYRAANKNKKFDVEDAKRALVGLIETARLVVTPPLDSHGRLSHGARISWPSR